MASRIIDCMAILTVAACSGASGPPPDPNAPTWYQDVAPIVSENCSTCHSAGGIAQTVPMDTYEHVTYLAGFMAEAVATRQMPPFKAQETDECSYDYPWKHDPRLTEEEISTIVAWANGGAPEGDASDPAPLIEPPDYHLTDVDQVLSHPTGYPTPKVGLEDDYVCFVLDPGLTEDAFLEAIEIVPDQVAVDHHALVFIDEDGDSEALMNENGWYSCLGGAGVDAQLIAGWAPGAAPLIMPQGSGARVSPESRLVLQMHYHYVDEVQRLDSTALHVRWAQEVPDNEAFMTLLGNARNEARGLMPGPNDRFGEPEFFIPAGVKDHTETMKVTLDGDKDYQVFMVMNHMHYIGVDMRVWVERASGGDDTCLCHTPQWDFDWQLLYQYDADSDQAPVIYAGDTVWIQCVYDNTLDNPGVLASLVETGGTEPVDVGIGEGSLDEMCLVGLGLVPKM